MRSGRRFRLWEDRRRRQKTYLGGKGSGHDPSQRSKRQSAITVIGLLTMAGGLGGKSFGNKFSLCPRMRAFPGLFAAKAAPTFLIGFVGAALAANFFWLNVLLVPKAQQFRFLVGTQAGTQLVAAICWQVLPPTQRVARRFLRRTIFQSGGDRAASVNR